MIYFLCYIDKMSITLFYHQDKIFDKTFMVCTKIKQSGM